MRDLFHRPSTVEIEIRKRIRLSVAAYAYEIHSDPIMSDQEFDKLAQSVDLKIDTGNSEMDEWFRSNFQSYTGQWIHNHPCQKRLEEIYQKWNVLGR